MFSFFEPNGWLLLGYRSRPGGTLILLVRYAALKTSPSIPARRRGKSFISFAINFCINKSTSKYMSQNTLNSLPAISYNIHTIIVKLRLCAKPTLLYTFINIFSTAPPVPFPKNLLCERYLTSIVLGLLYLSFLAVSAIPHLGHLPALSATTSGCIAHT